MEGSTSGKSEEILEMDNEKKESGIQELISIPAPQLYATTFSTRSNSHGLSLILQRSTPMLAKDGNLSPGGADIIVGVVSMSLHSAKDLSLLLRKVIAEEEKKVGPINTPYWSQNVEEK